MILVPFLQPLANLCQKYKVEKLFLFGSALRKDLSEAGDVDLIVEFGEVDLYNYAANFFDFQDELERLFGKIVDLQEYKAIRNPVFKEVVDAQKVQIYGR